MWKICKLTMLVKFKVDLQIAASMQDQASLIYRQCTEDLVCEPCPHLISSCNTLSYVN
jgi:hypothetical protein